MLACKFSITKIILLNLIWKIYDYLCMFLKFHLVRNIIYFVGIWRRQLADNVIIFCVALNFTHTFMLNLTRNKRTPPLCQYSSMIQSPPYQEWKKEQDCLLLLELNCSRPLVISKFSSKPAKQSFSTKYFNSI